MHPICLIYKLWHPIININQFNLSITTAYQASNSIFLNWIFFWLFAIQFNTKIHTHLMNFHTGQNIQDKKFSKNCHRQINLNFISCQKSQQHKNQKTKNQRSTFFLYLYYKSFTIQFPFPFNCNNSNFNSIFLK